MAFANPSSPNLPDFISFVQDGMQIPATALPANILAPAAPVLTAATVGGSLASGMVYVKITAVSAWGETTASPEASVAVIGPTAQVLVASPALQPGVTGYNVYAASASGAEVLQTATPVAIGTAYAINALATGTAAAPAGNTASSPWPTYAYNQAIARVLSIPGVASIEYTLAVYNCAGHILLRITPDMAGQTYFATARTNFQLLSLVPGVITSSSDQGTSESFRVPEQFANLTVGDLDMLKTPWGREYLAYAQDFGAISGLT